MNENSDNNLKQEEKKNKTKKWITVAIEIIRVIIAALSGGIGASVM